MSCVKFHAGAGLYRLRMLVVVPFLVLAAVAPAEADRIILRNLEIISDRTVTAFDEDGVRLDNGTLIGWYDIERAQVAGDKQAAFDRLLGELGDPLFRIRQRLRVGDYRDLATHVEPIYARYVGRSSPTAYLVLQATMWSRMASGRREAAVEPYLRCYEYLRSQRTTNPDLPGDRRLRFDPRTGMCATLTPIWFDEAAAKEAMPMVAKAASQMSARPPGVYIYFATLALAAGDVSTADRVLQAVRETEGPIGELRDIVGAQRELAAGTPGTAVNRLQSRLSTISPENTPLAMYWLGEAKLAAADPATQQRGLLQLLKIAALHGDEAPELAAAALFRAMETLRKNGDARGSVALRNELLVRYGQTYFADRAQAPAAEQRTEETP